MRQMLSDKKVKQLAAKTGLPVLKAMTRGNTDHRIDLCLPDGVIMSLWPDGTLEKSPIGWWVDQDKYTKANAGA